MLNTTVVLMNIMYNGIVIARESHNWFGSKIFINRQIACESIAFEATMLSFVCISAWRSIKWSTSNLLFIFSFKSGRYFLDWIFFLWHFYLIHSAGNKIYVHVQNMVYTYIWKQTDVPSDVCGHEYLCGAKITGISANRRISKISGAKNAARHKEFVNNRRFDSFDTRWSIDGVERHDSRNHVQQQRYKNEQPASGAGHEQHCKSNEHRSRYIYLRRHWQRQRYRYRIPRRWVAVNATLRGLSSF